MLPTYVLSHIFPSHIIRNINSFVPIDKKKKDNQISPSMQKELMKIQTRSLKGKHSMYLRDLEDFCLD